MHDDHQHLSDDVLLAALDGELEIDRRRDVERALASCATCRDREAALHQASLAAVLALRSDPDPDALGRARGRLRVALDGMPSVPAGTPPPAWLTFPGDPGRRWTAAAPAAVLVLAVCAGLFAWLTFRTRVPEADVAARAALPVPALTPGAWSAERPDALCASDPDAPSIPEPVRHQVLASYGMEHVPANEYELDYLVTPELGGVPDPKNLWPQRYMVEPWNALVKDELERLLVTLVCSGRLELRAAQTDMASNWIAAYRKYFRTREPLRTHVGRQLDDRRGWWRPFGTAATRPDRT